MTRGKRFPEILIASGLVVERHDELFSPTAPDEQWLAYCGRAGRVAVTHNERIRYTPNELAAVERHRVVLLVVVGVAPFAELAANFVRTLERIEVLVDQAPAPLIAKVYRPAPSELAKNPAAVGKVSVWYSPSPSGD